MGILLYTILPVIIAGILNMIWVKTSLLSTLAKPMDAGYELVDGRRLFGDNKTWKGFWGMVFFTAICTSIFHLLSLIFSELQPFSIIPYSEYTWPWESLFFGAIWGLAYVVFELPNSYIKRRLDICSGENASGLKGAIFIVIDQADSVIGCVLVMPLFCDINLQEAITTIVMATLLHLFINFLLYLVGLKNQPC